jgi:hypothetical protein
MGGDGNDGNDDGTTIKHREMQKLRFWQGKKLNLCISLLILHSLT